ncbi:HNH endonuclease signature motif containing protein [Streptomyces fagopyri]|uniref:HNH endonuclease signature motif containing protein n=1 Tax=Streptomyces fagopyri TaxID=2662397 RepID=UPI001D17A2FD|nr:HNH endonuclease [Streptomyces fagopyri]
MGDARGLEGRTADKAGVSPPDPYAGDRLARVVGEARDWTDLMRRLGLRPSGGRRRVLQEKAVAYGLDTSHFVRHTPWRKYPDASLAEAVASSSSLREVALKLGATPATGTLSHLRRRITAAGIDVAHFPGIKRSEPDLPFTIEELEEAAASANSVRGLARSLGVPEDSRSRAALARTVRTAGVDIGHFSHRRLSLPEDRLRSLVEHCTSYADVMRGLGLEVDDSNHRRIRRAVSRIGLDTSHFKRRSWGRPAGPAPAERASKVLVVLPEHAGRTNRTQLHWALTEIGVPYLCVTCGNTGEWLGRTITLQIDHVDGNWRDNRRENLRYLCPNCHALTATWCRRSVRGRESA